MNPPSTIGAEIAQAACALIGTPFYLHGRDPKQGLDCIGVLDATLRASKCISADVLSAIPNGYTLRTRVDADNSASHASFSDIATKLGLCSVKGPRDAGDILLLKPTAHQFHLAIVIDEQAIVHAHAALRKVVLGPLPCTWPCIRHWRFSAPLVPHKQRT